MKLVYYVFLPFTLVLLVVINFTAVYQQNEQRVMISEIKKKIQTTDSLINKLTLENNELIKKNMLLDEIVFDLKNELDVANAKIDSLVVINNYINERSDLKQRYSSDP